MAQSDIRHYGFIYKTTLPDGRYYIGQHKIISQSTMDPMYFGSGVIIKDYKKAHGTAGLSREILAYGESHASMNILEATYVTDAVLADPLNINLDRGGRNNFTRWPSVNIRIGAAMSAARAANPDKWPSRKGERTSRSSSWRFISPDGEIFDICGPIAEFCKERGFSVVTVRVAVKQGWKPRNGTLAGWSIFNLTTGKGTTRDTLNHGEARTGVNNPYNKMKRKLQMKEKQHDN